MSKGFSLVELLVVMAIILVITSVVITGQSSFNKTVMLANTAYDVALSLRSAESFGFGSRSAGGISNTGYGIHFPTTPSISYSLFSDTNAPNVASCHGLPPGGIGAPDAQYGNCVYEATEKVSDYNIGNGITISRICVRKGPVPGCRDVASSLDIVFSKPNSDAFMSVDGLYSSLPATKVVSACIVLTSPQGISQYVSVTLSGRITASATSCL